MRSQIFGGLVLYAVTLDDAGVVDEDVELAVAGDGEGHGVAPRGLGGDVERSEGDLTAGLLDFVGEELAVFQQDVTDDYGCTFRGEASGDGGAYASGSSGYEGYFSFKSHVGHPTGENYFPTPDLDVISRIRDLVGFLYRHFAFFWDGAIGR